MNLAARIHAQAQRTPQAIAARFGGAELTYAELLSRADRVAAGLAAQGVQAGDLIPVCMERSLGLVAALLGILRAGAAYVPLDPEDPPARWDLVFGDTQARCVVASTSCAARLRDGDRPVLAVEDDGTCTVGGAVAWNAPHVGPRDLAYVIYTSGSTGRPKGVMNEHGPVLHRLDWMIDALAISATDRILQKTTLSFDVSVWEFFAPLLVGARLVLARPGEHRDPAALVGTIRSEGVTILHFVPSMLTHFLDEPSASTCSSIRLLVASGEALLPAHVARTHERLGCPLWNLYGPTEAAIDVTYHLCDVERDTATVPIGRAITGALLYVVREDGSPCADGEPGELWIGGIPVARGYLRLADLTRERFRPDPFVAGGDGRIFRTGDRVLRRSDGEIEYLGRLDDQVKIRGVRIEPGEIEAALLACPGVNEAAVVRHDDPVRGAELIAYVVARRGEPAPSEPDLRERLAAHLPPSYVPARIEVLERLPLTPSGKLDRRTLSMRKPTTRAVDTAVVRPEDDRERLVLSVWQRALGAAHLGMDDDFLLAGGHSLIAVRIAARLEAQMGRRVPVATVLAARTPRTLARVLGAQAEPRGAPIERLPRREGQALTRGQLGLWLEHQLRPHDTAFHETIALRLQGLVEPDTLDRALLLLAQRHEALRTRFVQRAEVPLQVVDDAPSTILQVRRQEGADAAWIAEALRAEARRPFDLAEGLPWRALLLSTAPHEHHLLLTFHHIVIDEWSLGVLLAELGPLYRAAVTGVPAALPPSPLPMSDAAAWLLARDATDTQAPTPDGADDAIEEDLPPPLGGIDGPRGARVRHILRADLAARLTTSAASEGATPFELALAAFTVLIRRLTRRDTVIVGTPRTLREGPELEGTVGYLLDMVPARADLEGGPTYREVLDAVRSGLRSSAGRPSAGTGRRPFEIVFVFLQDPAERPALDGVQATPIDVWTGDAKYALGFELVLRQGEATCTIEYLREKLTDIVAEGLADQFARLLLWLLDHPERSVAEAPLLGDDEKERILAMGRGPRPSLPPFPSIHRWFEQVAASAPGRIAATWGQDRLTYGELDALANQLAHRLVEGGVREGDCVPLLVRRTPRMLAAILAILKAGGAYVPLDSDEPPARRSRILADLAPPLVLTESALTASGGLADLPVALLDDPTLATRPAGSVGIDGRPDAPAYVMFTSGSTGRPKGVVVPHRGVLRLVSGQTFADMDESRIWLHLAPGWFDLATLEIWAPLLHGGSCVVFPSVLPDFNELASALQRERIDSLWLTSSLFNAVVDQDPRWLAGLEQLLVGGEALSPPHVRRARDALPDVRLVNGYGPTENTTFTTCHEISSDDIEGGRPLPIGRPIAHTDVYVVDIDGQLAGVGAWGELCTGGAGLALGYLGLPGPTQERFVTDPWCTPRGGRMYRTGDLARWRPEGVLDFGGRVDDQVKIRGVRIEPGEVEVVLRTCAGVAEVAVIVLRDGIQGAELVAYVVPDAAAPTLDASGLRAELATRLPAAYLPAHVVLADRLPRTRSGKLDRRALAARGRPASVRPSQDAVPTSEIERVVLATWQDVLGADSVGMDTEFALAGGHSLQAVRIAARLETALRRRVEVRQVLSERTPRALARALEAQPGGPALHVGRTRSRDGVSLTEGQRALWLDHRMDADDTAFHVPVALRLEGRLDREALGQALVALSARHESLRTRFVDGSAGPCPVVDAVALHEWAVREAAGATSDAIREILEAESRRPFDLAKEQPWRALLLTSGDTEHHLLLNFHHIAVDEWSIGVLLGELGHLYEAGVMGRSVELGSAPLQMSDIAAWLGERTPAGTETPGGTDGAADVKLPPPLDPVDAPYGRRRGDALPSGLQERLRAVAAREGATPFELALAAFMVLIRRLTGLDDVRIGVPRTLREGAALEGVVGYLLEMVPAQAQLAGGPTFREVVASLRASLRAPPRQAPTRPGQRPFEIVFVFLQDPIERPHLPGVSVTPVPIWTGDVKYTLSLEVVLRQDRARGVTEYRGDRVADVVGEALARQWARLLHALMDDPGRSIAEVPLLGDAEQEQLLSMGQGPRPELPDVPSVHRAFEQVVRRAPGRVAARWEAEQVTYGELDAMANRLARRLVAQGVVPGDRVPLLLKRTPRMLAAILAVFKTGAAYAPLDPDEPGARRAQLLEELGARLVLTESSLSASEALGDLPRVHVDEQDLDALGDAPLPIDGSPDSPAYVMFTSGSTGRPKGVVVPHRGVLRLVFGQTFARIDDQRTWLHLAAGWFDLATLEIWAPLLHGGTCVVFPRALPEFHEIARAIQQHHVDSLWLTASLFNAVIDDDPGTLSGVTQLLIGGEALSPAHVRRAREALPDVVLVNGYGPTENTTFTTCHVITQADIRRGGPLPIGRPIAHTDVRVVDADGQLVPVGVPGELCAAGPGLAIGYLGRPEATQERFVADPWDPQARGRMYRTGDRVRWRPDGSLDFLGRLDRQIKLHGVRIEPGEVEAVLHAHPAVAAAAVDVVGGAAGSPSLWAWFVVRPTLPPPSTQELRLQLADRLPLPMVPTRYLAVETLPRTTSGKLDRARLRGLVEGAHRIEPAPQEALTPTEAAVAQIWSDVLGSGGIHADADFFLLGGTSLLAIRMVARVQERLGVRVPVRTLLFAPTLRDFAHSIDSGTAPAGGPAIVMLRDAPSGTPLFCLPGVGGHVFSFRHLLEHMPLERPLYGLQIQELDVRSGHLDSIESLAAELVRQVRSVVGTGPFDLVGYSFGGVVAFEMMQQLEAHGQATGRLILIDAYMPGVLQVRTGAGKILAHLRELARRTPRGMWTYVAQRIAKRLGWTPSADPMVANAAQGPLEERLAEVERRCYRAFGAYRGGPIRAPIVLLRALRLSNWLVLDPRDPTCGWGRVTSAGVRTRTLDCEHLDVFNVPHIEDLGRMIQEECLRSAPSPPPR